ncbi:hypothetical protein GCM10010435_54820 [Winogradskya consettensis]|uniref:NadR/Ttd14 AAA domain-containing protein n=2 Tax=Winogradskya TaxID=3240235 RepID=A0A919VLG9_9ACTN|nr:MULTISPECIES: hypothetical protein [Actinoplanes]GIE19087.1 hypothetical protein Ahu01nite_021890 [Actinoplanes humidus]GIM67692.1 hypothetical protein Aco04nite_07500 [Actinoplanes consettensis]
MIVVVEGPTAAGKTSWCRRYVGRYVPESRAAVRMEPDEVALARHWVRVGMERWESACEREREDGVAFCDTDPVKLHYAWGMAALGLAPRARFDRELAVTREAFRSGRLGFADAVLVALPDAGTLLRRRDGDETRRRRNFAAHVQLREPLQQWYTALDSLSPGRVLWDLPVEGVPKLPEPRADRCAVELLDSLVGALPPLRAAVIGS